MHNSNSLFQKMGTLSPRPRITALLQEAARFPLVQVVAGPGYGKTASIARFAQRDGTRAIWMRMTRLDQLPARFWLNFLQALEPNFPALLIRQLEALGYPDTLQKFDTFLHIFAREVYQGEPVLFVADEFGCLGQSEVRVFFETLLESRLDTLCLILIGRTNADVFLPGVRHDEAAQITTRELRFTPDEACALFAHHQNAPAGISPEELVVRTDGWPLALYLLALQPRESTPEGYSELGTDGLSSIFYVFESEYFLPYAAPLQRLLVKLSLLESFPAEILQQVAAPEDYPATVELLQANPFIVFDPAARTYSFHNMYHAFLTGRQYLLQEAEIKAVFSAAGDYCRESGLLLEAIEHFARCGRQADILSAIAQLAGSGMGIGSSAAQINYLRSFLLNLPESFREANPLADYLNAYTLMSNLEIEQAWNSFIELETRLLPNSSPAARALLGEVYTMLGAIRMMQNREDFGDYYARACALLPAGTGLKGRNKLLVENNHHFSMQDTAAGAAARMEAAVYRGVPYLVRAMNGGARGMAQLFSAEAGYLTNDLQKAQQYAYLAIHEAEENAQHDIICNAHLLLARSALVQGELAPAEEHVRFIEAYISDRQLHMLDDLKDTATSWLALKLDALDGMSSWIIAAGTSQRTQPPLTVGRDRLLSAAYLLRTQRYAALLALLERLDALYQKRGLWADRLYTYVLRAIAHMKLHEDEEALNWLHTAYSMSVENDIVMPFLEQGRHMRALADLARRADPSRFADGWLDSVAQKASTYAKKLAAIQKKHHGRPQADMVGLLSKREAEMLQGLSLGLTREELADQYHISVNTVKSIIRSLYNKLGAVNRADAIRIATQQNLL